MQYESYTNFINNNFLLFFMVDAKIRKEYKSIYLKIAGGILLSIVGGFIPFVNIIIVFPIFFFLSKNALKQTMDLPKKEGWKKTLTLIICGWTLVSAVFWWIISAVMLVIGLTGGI